MSKSKWKIASASLLVAGTAIGAGMLALPVSTAVGGFWPAIVMYLICYVFSSSTGLLLLEACLWMPRDSNIISLSQHLLGKKGKIFSWILYIFLFYCLNVAYVTGGGGFVSAVIGSSISTPFAILIFALIFAPVLLLGTSAVDRVNFILMIGLIASFILFVFIGFNKVQPDLLTRSNWSASLFALPVIFTSFSYQGIVPSLRNYFHGREKDVRKVIIIGSTIPFIVYVLWEYLILGIIPLEGSQGLLEAKEKGLSAVIPLKFYAETSLVYGIGQSFAFCALTTSFLGVSLGLFDFLSDGLKLPKEGKNKLALFLLVFIPPTLIAMVYPNIFIRALSYAGGIGCALLLGLMPVCLVWSGRYIKRYPHHAQLPGGKAFLTVLALFVVFELLIELINELHSIFPF